MFLPHDENRAESGSKPLGELKITGVNVDLKGIDKFAGVFNNAIKAISRGIGSFYEPIGRIRDAKADRAVANEHSQTYIDLTKKNR